MNNAKIENIKIKIARNAYDNDENMIRDFMFVVGTTRTRAYDELKRIVKRELTCDRIALTCYNVA